MSLKIVPFHCLVLKATILNEQQRTHTVLLKSHIKQSVRHQSCFPLGRVGARTALVLIRNIYGGCCSVQTDQKPGLTVVLHYSDLACLCFSLRCSPAGRHQASSSSLAQPHTIHTLPSGECFSLPQSISRSHTYREMLNFSHTLLDVDARIYVQLQHIP